MTQENSAKERILQAADYAFYVDGVVATGINSLTDRAGVARMSLYKNFSSKDEVIREYLARRFEEWEGLYEEVAKGSKPQRLNVVRSYILRARLQGKTFRGCGLLNAAAELPNHKDIQMAVIGYKHIVCKKFVEDCHRDGIDDEALIENWFNAMEGALVYAGIEKSTERLERFEEQLAAYST